jgi:hypothetical protein
MNFNHLGMVLVHYYKHMQLINHVNPGVTQLFLYTLFLSVLFNILTEMIVASSTIDVSQQHITSNIVRLHWQDSFRNAFCQLHVTINSASTKQSLPYSQMWFTGHCHNHILCLL